MRIFVFGSNRLGIHGAGAAKTAHKEWGARWGKGDGLTVNLTDKTRGSYAIPTKVNPRIRLPLATIAESVGDFLRFARACELEGFGEVFLITRIGCGLAGYKDKQIAPLFAGAPDNCEFDPQWAEFGLKTWTEAP
jgi:hypothetical protein